MTKRFLLPLALLAAACAAAAPALSQRRGPSTPDERRAAVAMVNALEADPLGKKAKDYRAALLYFLADVPDITVKVCTDVLGESKRMKGDYSNELFGQLMYSQAKFVIENPEKAGDDPAVYLAGVEGVLRTWQAFKAAKPKAKFPLMEELLEKQRAGTLADHVRTNAAKCKGA